MATKILTLTVLLHLIMPSIKITRDQEGQIIIFVFLNEIILQVFVFSR